jgi:hypothetical protein
MFLLRWWFCTPPGTRTPDHAQTISLQPFFEAIKGVGIQLVACQKKLIFAKLITPTRNAGDRVIKGEASLMNAHEFCLKQCKSSDLCKSG